MTRCGLLATLLLLLVAGAAGAGEGSTARILVTFDDPGMSRSAAAGPVRPGYSRRGSTYLVSIDVGRAARRLAKEFDLETVDEWPIHPLKVHCIVYAIDASRDIDKLLERLQQQPKVESAQRMNSFEVLDDPAHRPATDYAGLQHSMTSLHVTAAHRWSRGSGSQVAIIDTGADVHHPDLRKQIVAHMDFTGRRGEDFENDAHGTAIAGIIAASPENGIVSVAPSAQLSVLRACWYVERGARAVCDTFTLAKALSFAVNSTANVINLSLGGPADPLLARLVARAMADGKIVVTAAPPSTAPDLFPAGIDGVIVADAIERQSLGQADDRIFAPGDEILVAIPGGGFDYASGSSLSAAHVSGVIALLVSRDPELSPTTAGQLLRSAVDPAGGSLSACRALAILLGETGCGTPGFASGNP